MSSKEPPDPCGPRVIPDLEHSRITTVRRVLVEVCVFSLASVGVREHRPEFVDLERRLVGASTHLPEEDWSPGVELDDDSDHDEEGQEEQQGRSCDRQVQHLLEQAGGTREPHWRQADE